VGGGSRHGMARSTGTLCTKPAILCSANIRSPCWAIPRGMLLSTRASTLHWIDRATAPMLILQGENDRRVPPAEARQLEARLRSRGVTVETVFYPGEGHGFVKRENQIDSLERTVAFFERHVAGRTGQSRRSGYCGLRFRSPLRRLGQPSPQAHQSYPHKSARLRSRGHKLSCSKRQRAGTATGSLFHIQSLQRRRAATRSSMSSTAPIFSRHSASRSRCAGGSTRGPH